MVCEQMPCPRLLNVFFYTQDPLKKHHLFYPRVCIVYIFLRQQQRQFSNDQRIPLSSYSCYMPFAKDFVTKHCNQDHHYHLSPLILPFPCWYHRTIYCMVMTTNNNRTTLQAWILQNLLLWMIHFP